MSNQKQIGLGILQYIQDYDELFPISVVTQSATPPTGAFIGWVDAVQPYVRSLQVFQCPSEPASPVTDPTKAGYTDYWINKNASDGFQTQPESQNPAISILLGEGGSTNDTPLANATARFRSNGCNGAGDTTTLDSQLPICPNTASGLAYNLGGGGQHHVLGANYTFLDGHTKWYKATTSQSSPSIYTGLTLFSVSGSNPTFRVRDYP